MDLPPRNYGGEGRDGGVKSAPLYMPSHLVPQPEFKEHALVKERPERAINKSISKDALRVAKEI